MLKNLSLKILAYLALIIGNISRRQRHIDPGIVKTILINRTDRIGDAIVSLPFILELSKRFKVTVLTSAYNDRVLKDIVSTRLVSDIKKVAAPEYDLYLELVGISGLNTFLKVKAQGLCRYHTGFSLGPLNFLLDYSLNQNPVLFSKKHILDSYRLLLKESLGLEIEINDAISLDQHLKKPADFNFNHPYLLLNIAGGDKFRGPGLEGYATILNKLEFQGLIVVMDELSGPNLEEFKKHVKKENLYYLEKDYSVWELGYIARNSLLYIGSDSGITQLLSSLTNCIIFFAAGSAYAWRPYSKNAYTLKESSGLAIEETKNSAGLIKKVVYWPIWCRPCFDIGCNGSYCIKGLDKISVFEEINNTLKALS
ncbi:MAG: glycosyltransferase family 9 protein [Candidatus Omnitrophica bacterium]|nr:glycosyltransferase family 9 protein [Candidatus Omnitrophota bacterium]